MYKDSKAFSKSNRHKSHIFENRFLSELLTKEPNTHCVIDINFECYRRFPNFKKLKIYDFFDIERSKKRPVVQ